MRKSHNWKLIELAVLLTISGCAGRSMNSPPVYGGQVNLTPLPSSVQQIDSGSSEAYLQRAQNWLQKASMSLRDEMQM